MDLYRRLTRCSSLEMLAELEKDMKDAFGEPPRQALVFFALTELRLLCGLYGIESVIKKDPDVILTVRDAGRAQMALPGAPGTLRVIDEKTVYLRMPPTFMEPETCLMVLRNLMRKAYDREQAGGAEAAPAPQAATPAPAQESAAKPRPQPAAATAVGGEGRTRPQPTRHKPQMQPAKPAGSRPAVATQAKAPKPTAPELEKLTSLRDMGILTEEEFEAAKRRLAASRA
jgi:hypothetical protein